MYVNTHTCVYVCVCLSLSVCVCVHYTCVYMLAGHHHQPRSGEGDQRTEGGTCQHTGHPRRAGWIRQTEATARADRPAAQTPQRAQHQADGRVQEV